MIDDDRARWSTTGHAYAAEGHVLFDVPQHARLRQALAAARSTSMVAGARVEVAPYKKDPVDFVLWKPSKPGEPAWRLARGAAAGPAGTSSARR